MINFKKRLKKPTNNDLPVVSYMSDTRYHATHKDKDGIEYYSSSKIKSLRSSTFSSAVSSALEFGSIIHDKVAKNLATNEEIKVYTKTEVKEKKLPADTVTLTPQESIKANNCLTAFLDFKSAELKEKVEGEIEGCRFIPHHYIVKNKHRVSSQYMDLYKFIVDNNISMKIKPDFYCETSKTLYDWKTTTEKTLGGLCQDSLRYGYTFSMAYYALGLELSGKEVKKISLVYLPKLLTPRKPIILNLNYKNTTLLTELKKYLTFNWKAALDVDEKLRTDIYQFDLK